MAYATNDFMNAYQAVSTLVRDYSQVRDAARANRAMNDMRSAYEAESAKDMQIDPDTGQMRRMRSHQQIMDAIGNPNLETQYIHDLASQGLQKMYEPRYKQDYLNYVNDYFSKQQPQTTQDAIELGRQRSYLLNEDPTKWTTAQITLNNNNATQNRLAQSAADTRDYRDKSLALQAMRIGSRGQGNDQNGLKLSDYKSALEGLAEDPQNPVFNKIKSDYEAAYGVGQQQEQAPVLDPAKYNSIRSDLLSQFDIARKDRNSFIQFIRNFGSEDVVHQLEQIDPDLYKAIIEDAKRYGLGQ